MREFQLVDHICADLCAPGVQLSFHFLDQTKHERHLWKCWEEHWCFTHAGPNAPANTLFKSSSRRVGFPGSTMRERQFVSGSWASHLRRSRWLGHCCAHWANGLWSRAAAGHHLCAYSQSSAVLNLRPRSRSARLLIFPTVNSVTPLANLVMIFPRLMTEEAIVQDESNYLKGSCFSIF